jgi:hypothetical protein
MPKFSAQHYNAIAKDIREEFSEHMAIPTGGEHTRSVDMSYRAALCNLAIRFAKRFQKDNERFDPLKFLDACSPNTDLYPLSELWED